MLEEDEDDDDCEYIDDDDSDSDKALRMGEDDQLDDDFCICDEINQTDTVGLDAAIDAISEEDAGTIGEDSEVPDEDDSDSGTSFMTYVMYVGAAILVLALVGGIAHVCMNRKHASEFHHEQEMHTTHH